MGGVPHRLGGTGLEPVAGKQRRAGGDLQDVDLDAAAHGVADPFGGHPVRHRAPLDQRQARVHPAALGIGSVEAPPGQRGEEPALGLQLFCGGDAGGGVCLRMHPFGQPQPAAIVQLSDGGGRAEGVELGQEAFLEVPERALGLPLALGVAGLARLDLDAVVAGEVDRGRVQPESLALRHPQGPHPVGAADLGHAADRLEEAHQPLEGVLPVHRGREPPQPPTRPAQHAPEAPHLAQPPPPGPVAAVGEVELTLFAGGGLDRHAHGRGGAEPGPRWSRR